MIGIRYENYKNGKSELPFVLHTNLTRTVDNFSKEKNWHESIEIQLCTGGAGFVLLNGEKYRFEKNDIIVVNSNVIHYTYTNETLTYTCLIISTDFCKEYGFDYDRLTFKPFINSERLLCLLNEFINECGNESGILYKAKTTEILLRILIILCSNYCDENVVFSSNKRAYESVKKALVYIRQNYNKKISLDELAKEILFDKYALCREFKRLTGQTVIESLNRYRCEIAVDYLKNGYMVAETAYVCGFENLSNFTRTFKKYQLKLPSDVKDGGNV